MISVLNHLRLSSGNKILGFLGLMWFLSACSPKTTPPQQNPTPVIQPPVDQGKTKAENPKVEKKKEIKEMTLSMILPFDLDDVNYHTATSQDLKKSEIAIDFYQGFKMGLDSIAHQHDDTNFKLQVFDSKDDPTQLGALAAKGALKASDLVIGPVFPSGIKTFSVYSKNLQLPMVSPLAASDPDLFQNPYLISINNALEQHTYKAAEFIKNRLKPKKVILIRSGQTDEYKYAIPFKKGMDSLAKGIPLTEIGIKAVGNAGVYKYLSPVGLNVIVLPSTDRPFLMSILPTLQDLSSTYQIAIIGHPNWAKASFLDYGILEKLDAYTTSSYQVDYSSTRVADFVKKYRTSFSLEPSEFSFKGFDIGYYFGKLMSEKGKNFMSLLDQETLDGIENDFKFKRDPKNGYYNTSLMMMKFETWKLKKVY